MNIPREKKKSEAIRRMKLLEIFPDAIRQFEKDDIVMVSEPPLGGLYWLEEDDKERVRKFEEETNGLVYLVARSFTEIGVLDSMFYVSDWDEEWEIENMDLSEGYSFVYVYNHDTPEFSELGSIGFEKRNGGLIRTA